jgi:hypothetical protein
VQDLPMAALSPADDRRVLDFVGEARGPGDLDSKPHTSDRAQAAMSALAAEHAPRVAAGR